LESTQKKLHEYVEKFRKDDLDYFEAVQQIFKKYPKNVIKAEVAIKFAVLDKLYSTVIFDKDKMINHIHNLATKESLDNMLRRGNLEAIEKIRRGHRILTKSNKERDNYSFATKYCHFSNPKCYPLYDQYVEWAISELKEKRKIEFEIPKTLTLHEILVKPENLKKIIDRIIQEFKLIDYQTADRALWKYGKALAKEK
jgi:hypothetical protein